MKRNNWILACLVLGGMAVLGGAVIVKYHAAHRSSPATTGPRILKWRNPMDPTIFSDHAMKDNMGMDYIPVYASPSPSEAAASTVPGRATVTLDARRSQIIDLGTTEAVMASVTRIVRMSGQVDRAGDIILAQALDLDGPELRAGQDAEVLEPGRPALKARVLSVDHDMDAYSRTFAVRLGLDKGPARGLWPGMYCEVDVLVNLGRGVVVPTAAILDNGERTWVFVDDGKGHLESRAVLTGPTGDHGVELLKGVSPGEQVVTSGNFLLDSESSFKAAAHDFGGSGHD